MKKMNIKNRFESIQVKNPLYSSYTAFALAVSGMKMLPDEIEKAFDKLVERGDYRRGEKGFILQHLFELSEK